MRNINLNRCLMLSLPMFLAVSCGPSSPDKDEKKESAQKEVDQTRITATTAYRKREEKDLQDMLKYIMDGGLCFDVRPLRPTWQDSWGSYKRFKPIYESVENGRTSHGNPRGFYPDDISVREFSVKALATDLGIPSDKVVDRNKYIVAGIRSNKENLDRKIPLSAWPTYPDDAFIEDVYFRERNTYKERLDAHPKNIRSLIARDRIKRGEHLDFGGFKAYVYQGDVKSELPGQIYFLHDTKNMGCVVGGHILPLVPPIICVSVRPKISISFMVPQSAQPEIMEINDRFEKLVDSVACKIRED